LEHLGLLGYMGNLKNMENLEIRNFLRNVRKRKEKKKKSLEISTRTAGLQPSAVKNGKMRIKWRQGKHSKKWRKVISRDAARRYAPGI